LRARELGAAELLRLARGICAERASLPRALPSRLVDALLLQALETDPEAEVDELER
jgi:hypothetical protein